MSIEEEPTVINLDDYRAKKIAQELGKVTVEEPPEPPEDAA